LFDKLNRRVPPGVDPNTGEIKVSGATLYKLHHMGENRTKVQFTPINRINEKPSTPSQSTTLPAQIDRAISEAGFPTNRNNRYSYSNALVSRSVITPVLKALPEGKLFKTVAGIIIAAVAIILLVASAILPEPAGNRAQAGHTYNGHGYDITGK
jgi:hypothetical protein